MESEEEKQRTIWCGNLSDRVSEEILYELFLQAAPIQKVKIPKDREGRQSSYAFITCKHDCSVPYVIQLLNGITLFDRRINLKPRCINQSNSNVENYTRQGNLNQNSPQIENHNLYHGNMNVPGNPVMQMNMQMLVGENLFEMQNSYGQTHHQSPMIRWERNSYRNDSRRDDLKPYRQPNNYNHNHYGGRHDRNNYHHGPSSNYDKGRKHRHR